MFQHDERDKLLIPLSTYHLPTIIRDTHSHIASLGNTFCSHFQWKRKLISANKGTSRMKPKISNSMNVFVAVMILMILHLQCTLSFYLSPPNHQRGLIFSRIHKKSCLLTIKDESSAEISSHIIEQNGYMNQMKDWRGRSKSTSEFVTHFIASGCDVTIADAIASVLPQEKLNLCNESKNRMNDILQKEDDKVLSRLETNFRNDPSQFPLNQQLHPVDLIAMGSVWFLPSSAPRDPALGLKPVRLEAKNLTSIMTEGDYLRVHHMPRRFPEVHAFDWGKQLNEETTINNDDDQLPGVIIHEDVEKGYIVLNKPAGVPVHPTVDNVLENVAGAVGRAMVSSQKLRLEEKVVKLTAHHAKVNQTAVYVGKQKKKKEPLLYVVAPQRLDQNTSGIFVVATKKTFAGYFAKLLRTKTDNLLKANNSTETATFTTNAGHIYKKYRCLVCIQPNKISSLKEELPSSIRSEVDRLQSIAKSKEVVRHYLYPEKRAPRIYSEEYHKDWLECLMKITDVGDTVPVVGSTEANALCKRLWGIEDKKPPECTAIVQVEVELLTGRAHQIRGQLSALGFSLCGDAMYGGTSPVETKTNIEIHSSLRQGYTDGNLNSDKLALQCCELQFLDPDYTKDKKGNEVAVRSRRVNKFRLKKAWWTPLLENYKSKTMNDPAYSTVTTNIADLHIASEMRESEANESTDNMNVLRNIKRVQLSPGQNKYVMIKAIHPSLERPEWFVKTASPSECGGPFHADVARGLVNELNVAGFDTIVMGGGRIDYDSVKNHARVYGFSYGFGKGDHEFASLLIEQEGFNSSFDNSDAFY